MSASNSKSLCDRLAQLGLAAQAGIVAGAVLLAALLTAIPAYAISSMAGLAAVAVAAAACLGGALAALAIGEVFRGPSAPLFALAAGMAARTIAPLVAGVALHLLVPALATAGMIYYLLGFYLIGLAVETLLLAAKVSVPACSTRKAM